VNGEAVEAESVSPDTPPARRPLSPAAPGRSCPLHYRYAPSALARAPDFVAETVYVIGGLYGNRSALDAVLDLASHESGSVALVFNGDFNWFNIDDAGFASVNDGVLKHRAIRGNVETEIAGEDDRAGCGCAYPEWVGDAEVARSNEIIARLRAAARRHPRLRGRLGALPMNLIAEVAGMRVAIVHGDAGSLAGWGFAQEALVTPQARARLSSQFAQANVRVFASSHTCLPVAADCGAPHGRCVLINNGAAGMPNFRGATCGLISRIATTAPSQRAGPLYGTRLGPLYIDALPLHYDASRWLAEFAANWPAGSPAHRSYFDRIARGPRYTVREAIRWHASS
jgi:hypothetical protein